MKMQHRKNTPSQQHTDHSRIAFHNTTITTDFLAFLVQKLWPKAIKFVILPKLLNQKSIKSS